MRISGKLFRILYHQGLGKGGKTLRNYTSLTYDRLIEELSMKPMSNVKNIFHDDKNPSNQRQFTRVELLQLWGDVSKVNSN